MNLRFAQLARLGHCPFSDSIMAAGGMLGGPIR